MLVIVFPSDPENTLPSCVDQSAGTVQRGQLARSHYGQDQVLDRAVLGSSGAPSSRATTQRSPGQSPDHPTVGIEGWLMVFLPARRFCKRCHLWLDLQAQGPQGQSRFKRSMERRHAEMKAGFKLALKLRGVRDRMPTEPQQNKPLTSCMQLFACMAGSCRQSPNAACSVNEAGKHGRKMLAACLGWTTPARPYILSSTYSRCFNV